MLVTARLVWVQAAYAQRLSCPFGPVIETAIPGSPEAMMVRRSGTGARQEIALLCSSPPSLQLFSSTDSCGLRPAGSIPLPGRRTAFAKLSGTEPARRYLCADPMTGDLSIVSFAGELPVQHTVHIDSRGSRLVAADLDRDGKTDLVLFGKERGGVSVVRGRGGESFAPATEIFTDISVADLLIQDINGDGMPDVILTNWLSNSLSVYYGISNLVFSEQITVELPGEPGNIALTWLKRRRYLELAVTLTDRHAIAVIRGTSDGEFVLRSVLDILGQPLDVAFADADADGIPDIAGISDRGAFYARGTAAGSYDAPRRVGAGARATSWWVGDVDGDHLSEFLILHSGEGKISVLESSRSHQHQCKSSEYVVGSRPQGVTLCDANGDGLADIAVANRGSNTVSLLMNDGMGGFSGEYSVSVPDQPVHIISALEGGRPGNTVITSHAGTDRLVVIRWDPGNEASSFALPSGPHPYAFNAWLADDRVHVLARQNDRGEDQQSISLFERIGGRQFVEHNMHAQSSERPLAVVARPAGRGRGWNVYFASNDSKTRAAQISLGEGDSLLRMGASKPLLSVPDSSKALRWAAASPSLGGHSPDLLLAFGKPVNAVGYLFDIADTFAVRTPDMLRNIVLDNESDLQVADVNGDGRADIVVHNQATEALEVYLRRPTGYAGPAGSIPVPGCGGFTLGSVAGASGIDLIFTQPARGTVTVLAHPWEGLK